MFSKLGGGVTRHPWIFISGWLVALVVALMGTFWGFGHGGLFDRLSNSESMINHGEAWEVQQAISSEGSGESVMLIIKGLDLTDPAEVGQVQLLMTQERSNLEVDGVASVVDPFLFPDPGQNPQAQALFSSQSDGFITAITLEEGLSDSELDDAHEALDAAIADFRTELVNEVPDSSVSVFSTRLVGEEIIGQVQQDLVTGETIGLPVALLLLIIVFGGLIAAGLPLIGALVSIVCGMALLWVLTFFIGIDSFLLNVVSIIGLALSIDYGLLIVSRYREEITARLTDNGYPADLSVRPGRRESKTLVREAVRGTVISAGRTVSFSALTIAFAISGLLVMDSPILKTVGAGGMIVTILAVMTAVTLVPSLLTLLGVKLLKPSVITKIPVIRSLTRAVGDASSDHGFFSRLAARVHAHPWIVMLLVSAILATMAYPITTLRLRSNFSDYIPAGSEVGVAYDTIQADYPALATPTVIVLAEAEPAETADLYEFLSSREDVTFVSPPTALPDDSGVTRMNVILDTDDAVGAAAVDLVREIRDHDAGFELRVGGPAALQIDFTQSIIDDAPLALSIVVIAVFVLMFLMTGSLIVPVKALIINAFSLVASLGATTWIFDNGHFGMPVTHGLETFIVACMVAFGFGLAMDYEVFLLARIKEFWDLGYTNDEAVERGLQRSGRIITSAAAIIVAVFIGFIAGDMLAIKQIGVALAITVITDATLVRMLLVPATMTVLGKWNWWAPKPLKWVYERFKIVH